MCAACYCTWRAEIVVVVCGDVFGEVIVILKVLTVMIGMHTTVLCFVDIIKQKLVVLYCTVVV